MEWLDPIREWSYLGNDGVIWLGAIGAAIAVLVIAPLAIRAIANRIRRLSEKTENELDDLVAHLLSNTRSFFYLLLAAYVGSLLLTLPEEVGDILLSILILGLLLQAGLWGSAGLKFGIEAYKRKVEGEDPASATTVGALGFIGMLVLWSVLVLVALSNLGIDITALVTGLGIGGVAVALAVQNVLGDLLASLSIVFDKPFVIGDFIIVGDQMGTVEHVGLKTTRVRAISGEQLVFGNSDMLGSRIRNYKRMQERRIVFAFGVVYQTSADKLETINEIVRRIIEAQPEVRFDRSHFKSFGDSSLDFEVVYYMLDPDYNRYMDTQQAINLALFRELEQEGIEFAYPTRTLYMAREGSDVRGPDVRGPAGDRPAP